MRRAGWGVWIAYDLPGSYEELPPNLLEELQRDQRWCHGQPDELPAVLHRRAFTRCTARCSSTGVMSYLSAPLWFLFLLLSTALLAVHTLTEPQYFIEPRQLFPIWPQWHPDKAIALFSTTFVLLFLPKVLGVLLRVVRAVRSPFGGRHKAPSSMLMESAVLHAAGAGTHALPHALRGGGSSGPVGQVDLAAARGQRPRPPGADAFKRPRFADPAGRMPGRRWWRWLNPVFLLGGWSPSWPRLAARSFRFRSIPAGWTWAGAPIYRTPVPHPGRNPAPRASAGHARPYTRAARNAKRGSTFRDLRRRRAADPLVNALVCAMGTAPPPKCHAQA